MFKNTKFYIKMRHRRFVIADIIVFILAVTSFAIFYFTTGWIKWVFMAYLIALAFVESLIGGNKYD